MKIAIYGASGYTGRLAVADLAKRGVSMRLVGRNLDRLREAAAELGVHDSELAEADSRDPDALAEAFRDCDTVISCVAPFTHYGAPILHAAIAAGCHYVDTSGEQRWVKRVFEEFSDAARKAGITVVPATTDDGVPGDLIAQLVARGLDAIDRISVAHGVFQSGVTRGSMKSFVEIASNPPFVFAEGEWREYPAGMAGIVDFPGEAEGHQVWLLAGPEIVPIAQHIEARRIEATINVDVSGAVAGLTPEIIAQQPTGPTDEARRGARFTMMAEIETSAGAVRRGHVSGRDVYGMTAVISVEAAIRLAAGKAAAGVLAPSQAFDAEDFLGALAAYGVIWEVDARAR